MGPLGWGPLKNQPPYIPYIVGVFLGICPFNGLLGGVKQLGAIQPKGTNILPMNWIGLPQRSQVGLGGISEKKQQQKTHFEPKNHGTK